MLRLIWRLLLGSVALMVAVPFGTFVLGAGILSDPILSSAIGSLALAALKSNTWTLISEVSLDPVITAAAAFAKSLIVLLAVPPTLAALIGETFGWRSATWYYGVSGLLTACLPWIARGGNRVAIDPALLANGGRLPAILFVAGAASGLVYWLVAGRSAAAPAAAS